MLETWADIEEDHVTPRRWPSRMRARVQKAQGRHYYDSGDIWTWECARKRHHEAGMYRHLHREEIGVTVA